MFLKLERWSQKSREKYPWVINTDCIESINDTRQGTVIILKGDPEPKTVIEGVEEIHSRMIGEPIYEYPDWNRRIYPYERGDYLCWVRQFTMRTKYKKRELDTTVSPSDHVEIKHYENNHWNVIDENEVMQEVIGWIDLPKV